ncbi:MAG: winged helix-turn-helix transcriptional regulator [Erysipelotrichaceae bacterium]|nr:winged helix-turn-helix transcriptional regulator [Erysipelotrichaceae bacterium]
MEESAVRLLVRCARHLNHRRGSRPGQERILYLLMKNKTMTQKELQKEMQIAQGSMSEILIKLEAQSLIVKKKNPADARSVVLSLSAKGLETARVNHKLWLANEEHLLDALNEEEMETLGMICAKLLKSWEMDNA